MRRLFAALALVSFIPAVRADDVTDLRDRALKAVAPGTADIQKVRIFTVKCKGTSNLVGDQVPTTLERVGVYPSVLKNTWTFGEGAEANQLIICAVDDRGWRYASGMPAVDLDPGDLNDVVADAYAVWASTLITLTDKDTTLSLAGASKVGADPVVGLKLSRRPFPEVTLYFDEKTYLLRKLSYKSREGGAVRGKDIVFGGHKLVDGLMVPGTQRLTIQGKEIYSWSAMEYTFPDKMDKKVFAKP